MWVHSIMLFQRPELGDRQVLSEKPLLFLSLDGPSGALAKLRKHIDDTFSLPDCADQESLVAYENTATDCDKLSQWFDNHYCYFQISHQAEELIE